MFTLAFRAAFVLIAVTALSARAAAQSSVPLPRLEIQSMSPAVSAQIDARRQATHFMRLDDGPRYVIYGPRAETRIFPADLTPARGKAYLDEFAALAPSMGCRTDDVADAYEFLIQAAMLAYNGTHFAFFTDGPKISCGARSFGAVSLDSVVHIYLGGTPRFIALRDRDKQALYETFIVAGGYLLDESRAKPGSAVQARARVDAADAIRALTGVRASRVHLTEGGLQIDDQAR